MSPTLPDKLLQKLSTKCGWGRCPTPKAPGDRYCDKHQERQADYERRSHARRRAKLRAARLCRDCGGSLPKRWNSGRCRDCQRAQSAARVKGSARQVKDPPPARGHFKTEATANGTRSDGTRTRYVGQAHRGGPTREEQDAGLVRLVLDAQRLLAGFLAVFPVERPALDALPRIQRAEAWELVASSLTRSARLSMEVAAGLAGTWRTTCAGCGRRHDADED